ncbi:MAG: UDP-N-acetylmuramoylalanyl-D-glutamate--2,6-diaminopimelate ligase [Polaromonas sp.]|nr:UDP-N-acetylmuramoylalanyl-D-glutamate--2,6-diaminopimelate ligase [Polaromonas sp.]
MSAQLHTPGEAAAWLRKRVTGNLWADSRKVSTGDGFIAWPGAASDARRHVGDALAAGARACVVEAAGVEPYGFTDVRVASYPGLRAAAAPIAAAYFENPSQRLQMVAVTGTNGKTTSTWWLAQALGKLGRRCGIVGTLGIGTPEAMVFNGLTTPDPVLLQQQLRQFADQGFTACAIEASSIGLAERRLDATCIQVAVFTNFSQDHLDYHGSMEAYWKSKKSLFAWDGLKSAVINLDDAKGEELNAELAGSALEVWTISMAGPARLRADAITQGAQGLVFDVVEGASRHTVTSTAVGMYNVTNLLGVIAAMRALGLPLEQAAAACEGLLQVPGRLETIAVGGLPLVAIDYAHTPDALEKVLGALRAVAQERAGRLWCVFGCGGDRDSSKRPLMAAVAQKGADQIVVTSDNPRSESPAAIISQVLMGITHAETVHVQADRAQAIASAIAMADAADVVLLAGKGHENYQEVLGVRHPFSDRTHAETSLAARLAKGGAS